MKPRSLDLTLHWVGVSHTAIHLKRVDARATVIRSSPGYLDLTSASCQQPFTYDFYILIMGSTFPRRQLSYTLKARNDCSNLEGNRASQSSYLGQGQCVVEESEEAFGCGPESFIFGIDSLAH
jgi:hypothetical protein